MAKALLSERQVSSFMKLANIKQDRIKNFLGSGKKALREDYGSMTMEEDEPSADMGAEGEMPEEGAEEMPEEEMEMDMEPEAPEGEDLEASGDEFKTFLADVLKELLPAALKQAMAGEAAGAGEEGVEDMELSSDEMSDEEGPVEDEEFEEEEVEEEEPELQESRVKKAVARNLKGGDKRNIKESVAFKNVDLITDDEVINEVLKRVIRRLV